MLDGEGGYTVFGKLLPADKSLSLGGLPLGLATMKLIRPVAKGKSLTWGDVEMDESLPAYKIRKGMEGLFAKTGVAAAK
jgi:predicted homoserine dehydrogenase-like protein